MTEEIQPILINKVTAARMRFSELQPWLGTLIGKLEFIITTDKRFQTAATDGKRVFFRDKFVAGLNVEELVFVVGHELLHCLLTHLTRCEDRDKTIWNVACDYAVNGLLISYKVGSMPSFALYNKKFAKLTAEAIYDKIHNDVRKYGNELTLDDHEVLEQDESTDWSDELVAASATKQASGSLVKELTTLFRDTQKSSAKNNIDWSVVLRNYVKEKIKDDVSYLRPNKKTQASGIVLPSRVDKDTITVAVAVDTSGSIDLKLVGRFLSELDSIFNSVENLTLHLWCFNDRVENYVLIEVGQLDLLQNYKAQGSGGTDYTINWKLMEKEGIKPDLFIMLTDGCPCGSWGDSSYCSTVFVIHGNKSTVAPFGETLYLD